MSFDKMKSDETIRCRERLLSLIACNDMGLTEADSLLWELLESLQGKTFYTMKGLPFTYQIKGYELFISRKEKSLTRATVLLAFHHAVQLQKNGCNVDGPKKLGTFGASYLYPIFVELGIIIEQTG